MVQFLAELLSKDVEVLLHLLLGLSPLDDRFE